MKFAKRRVTFGHCTIPASECFRRPAANTKIPSYSYSSSTGNVPLWYFLDFFRLGISGQKRPLHSSRAPRTPLSMWCRIGRELYGETMTCAFAPGTAVMFNEGSSLRAAGAIRIHILERSLKCQTLILICNAIIGYTNGIPIVVYQTLPTGDSVSFQRPFV